MRERSGVPRSDRRCAAQGARKFLIDTENIAQFVPQPYARRRAAKKIEVLGEELPDVTMVTFQRPSVAGRNAQPLKRYALRIEHAKDIVIRDDEQIDRSAKGVIQIGKNARIHMPMRAEQRAIGNLRIELHGDDAHGRFRIEITSILHQFSYHSSLAFTSVMNVSRVIIPCRSRLTRS